MKCVKSLLKIQKLNKTSTRAWSTVTEQTKLWDAENERQQEKIGRIEKIQVSYQGRPHNAQLLLNKGLSTPYDAARHISEWLTKEGALALVDHEETWDMHRPLENDCSLKIMTFTDQQPQRVNKVFWRTCSFLLGAVVTKAFRDDLLVTLHSFPSPRVTSGSFVYDATIDGLSDWSPTTAELRSLSAESARLAHASLPILRLKVDKDFALEIFQNNRFKIQQIPGIAQASSDGKITLYRVGDHIDISRGPMIANTNFVGRTSITAVHPIETDGVKLLRFQGVALPRGLMLNHFAYKILEERAKKLNMNDAEYIERRTEMTC